MEFLRDIYRSLVPQITWALVFTILGYLGKTLIDYFKAKAHRKWFASQVGS